MLTKLFCVCRVFVFFFFFFKQKTAYEMRISDWSSDVCSSDLVPPAFLIGGAGRLTRKKGWDVLITAFRGAELPSDARLWLFGSGSAEKELHRLARGDSRIRFGGWRKDLKDVYQSLDLFVCPSRFEPLPRVMLEAYDAGVPVISSDAGGCPELVEEHGGDLFPREDVPALIALLERHARERAPRRQVD